MRTDAQNNIVGLITSPDLPNSEMEALKLCALWEVRADLLGEPQLWPEMTAKLRKLQRQHHLKIPIIFTLRRRADGGCWEELHANLSGSELEETRYNEWKNILQSQEQPDWIDLEWDFSMAGRLCTDCETVPGIVFSRHDFKSTPGLSELLQLEDIAWEISRSLQKNTASVTRFGLKFAMTPVVAEDVETLQNFLGHPVSNSGIIRATKPGWSMRTAFGMGEVGRSTRLSCAQRGGWTYGVTGAVTAPGQYTVQELYTLLGEDSVTDSTEGNISAE